MPDPAGINPENIVAPSFEEYYHFDGDQEGRLPYFSRLLQDCPSQREYLDSAVSTIGWVEELSIVQSICAACKFNTIISDLSIIQDERLLENNDPYMVNHVVVYKERLARPRLLDAYIEAMAYMRTVDAEREPLVAHSHFYDYAHLTVPIDAHEAYCASDQSTQQFGMQGACRQRYSFQPFEGSTNPSVQAARFVGYLLRKLRLSGISHSLFKGAYFVGIPFHRSPYRPAVRFAGHGGSRSNHIDPFELLSERRASPGGGLFVVITPTIENASSMEWLRLCVISLHAMLTRATLSDSATRLGYQLTYNDLLANSFHLALNGLKIIQSDDICRAVSTTFRVPPQMSDLVPMLQNNESVASGLLTGLRRAVLGENVARAAMAFAEMTSSFDETGTSQHPIRSKFSSNSRTLLSDVITDAAFMVNEFVPEDERLATIDVSVRHTGPDSRSNGNWYLTRGYLHTAIIRGLFCELLLNASQYGKRMPGKREGTEVVLVMCTISTDARGGMRCALENDNRKPNGGNDEGGFLRRMARVFRLVKGIELTFGSKGNGKSSFRVELWLGPITCVVDHDGLQTGSRSYEVAPAWE
jgi:hypothetical protein